MHYRSLVTLTAIAASVAPPSEAIAQSPTGRAMEIMSKNAAAVRNYDLKRASLAKLSEVGSPIEEGGAEAAAESTASSFPDETLRIVPEQRTKSAAYKWEAAFLTVSAIDAVETISCLNRATCTEHNPLWGSHPSSGKIVAAKLGLSLVHFGVFKLIADRDPHTALRAAQISAAVQGGIAALNLRTAF